MDNKTFATSLVLLLAGLAPVAAYHIDGTSTGQAVLAGGGAGPLTTADWVLDTSGLTACETVGTTDEATTSPVTRGGLNGLCSAGENDATGTVPFDGGDADTRADAPAAGRWVRLDVCDSTTVDRNGGVAGPYAAAGTCVMGASGSALSLGGPGRRDAHGFSGRVGAFTCFVPTHLEPSAVVTRDFALYYDALYAWWSYTGTLPYTAGNNAGELYGTVTGGAGGADGAPHPSTVAGALNNVDRHHGHATVFPSLSRSEPGASTVGSVETELAAPPAGMSDNPALGLGGAGLTSNNCGGSPSNPPSGTTGPVVRAPYATGANGAVISSLPLCAHVWDGFVETIYNCALPAGLGDCTVLGRSVAVASLEFGGATEGDVVGGVSCAGGATGSATTKDTSPAAVPVPCTPISPLTPVCVSVTAAPPTVQASTFVCNDPIDVLPVPDLTLVTVNRLCVGAGANPTAIPVATATSTGRAECLRTGGSLPTDDTTIWAVVCTVPADP